MTGPWYSGKIRKYGDFEAREITRKLRTTGILER